MSDHKKVVSQLLEEDYRYAAVLHQFGIDFFDYLNHTLAEACRISKVEPVRIQDQLEENSLWAAELSKDYRYYAPGRLVTHLQKSHHNYAQVMLPIIQHHIERSAQQLGKEYPHLHLLNNIFDSFRKDFLAHIHYENTVVFPYIKKLERNSMSFSNNFLLEVKSFSLDHFIMKHAHDDDDMLVLRKLTHNFKSDSGDHIAYRILMRELHDFEQDLQVHSLVEEQVLLPKVQKLEKALMNKVKELLKSN